MVMKKKEKNTEVHILDIERGQAQFYLVGTEPMLHNCLSNKARHELLLPSGPKTATEKKNTLKHVPLDEYRESIYFSRDEKGATFVQHLSSAFRQAMRTAALDLPGVTKTEIGRMLYVIGDRVDIYGLPQMDMRIVRQAGINRTPDVRTRCILAEWCCNITVSFTKPQLSVKSVTNLLAAAGMSIGVGDYRNEKGAGNYGLWRICSKSDRDYKRISKNGRKVQVEAMRNPTFYNEETDELYSWYKEAVKEHRSFKAMTVEDTGKGNGVGADAGAEA